MTAEPAVSRGERTRATILDAALVLFRERGYDSTTMRAVATSAGVSVGNAYYYFDSKDHLVQAFYDEIQVEHAKGAAAVLAREHQFARRLVGCELAWLEVSSPYHAFAGKFFKVAAEPTSPLSPFSEESRPAREASTAIYRAVLEGSGIKVDAELRGELPDLLWLYHMGVVLFWVHDATPGQERTRLLIERTVPLIERLVGLSRLRVLRSATRESVALIRMLRGG